MYEVSDKLDGAILGSGRTFKAKVKSGDAEATSGIMSVVQYGQSTPDSYASVGGAVSSYVEVKMWKPDFTLKGQEVELSLGIELDGEVEWVPLGLFTVQKPQEDDGAVAFTAYDRIQAKMSATYFSELTYPVDAKQALQEISQKTGVPIDTSSLPDGVMLSKRAVVSEAGVDDDGNATTNTTYETPFSGYLYRDALGYIAQLYGKFALADRTGTVVFRWYEESGYTIPASKYYDDLVTSDTVFSVTGISCVAGDTTLVAGGGAENIQISNPVMTQERLDVIYEQIKGFQFLPAGLSFPGDMRLDLGDIVTVNDKKGNVIKVPVMSVMHDFDGGLITQLQSFGGTEEEAAAAKGPTAQALDRVYTDLFLVKELVGNKASFDYVYGKVGEFDTLKAQQGEFEELTAQNFTAANGRIDTLSGDFASFKSGEFDTLKARQASFETVTAENFTVTNGQITTISGDLSSYKTQVAGQFTAVNADITSLNAKDAELETAVIGKASITDLEAVSTRTGTLEADVASINTLLNGNLTSSNIQSLTLTAQNTTIENGMIKNAMIESVAADKISAGNIYTNLVRIYGDSNKRLSIVDNTIQISDGTNVRVQIGEDASGDYNLYLWDSAGNMLWNATGVTESGLNDGIIKDVAVAADANISGSKLDIESVVREVNGATTKLKSTTILLDDKNQTLDVVFNTMETTITSNLSEAKSYADSKASTTLSNAQQYALDQANAALSSAKGYADAEVDGIEIGGRNLALNSEAVTVTRTDTSTDYLREKVPIFKNSDYGINLIADGGEFTLSFDYDITGITTACTICMMLKHTSTSYAAMPGDKGIALSVGDNSGCFKYTFTPSSAQMQYGVGWLLYGFAKGTNGGAVFSIKHFKLEKGNKATDWSPAPEDTEAEITNLTEITTTHTTSISTMQGQISSLIAEDTSIKGNYDALVSRYNATVSTVDSMQTTIGEHTTLLDSQSKDILAVQTKANTIESDLSGTKQTISENYTALNSKIDGIEIGGRNLLRNTKTLSGWGKSSNVTLAADSEGFTVASYAAVSSLAWNAINNSGYAIQFSAVRGKTVTFSLEVKSDDYASLNSDTSHGLIMAFALCTGASTARTLYRSVSKYSETLSGTWKKVAVTATLDDSYFSSGSGTIDDDTRLYMQVYNYSLYHMDVRKLKLEAGTKATDWTPAPEDAESEISSTTSRVTAVETDLSGVKTRVSAVETALTTKADSSTVSSLTSRVSTCETTLDGFETSLATTNKTVSDNYTALMNTNDGFSVMWDYSAFGTANTGEAYICARDPLTGALSDANGFVMFGGTKRTVPKGMVNPNTYVPYNRTVYIVLRLSSATSTTGTLYLVWYNSGWKSGNINASTSTTISDWTWANTSDIVLASFVEPSSEAGFVDCQIYHPALTSQQVMQGNSAYLNAANAQSTANTAKNTADTNATTIATHTETLSTHETRIKAAEDSITLKVSTSDFNSYKTTVDGELTSAKSRLTTAESSITTMQGQISLKVEQTDIDTAINGIQVGGRNLVLDSETKSYTRTDTANNWSNLYFKISDYGIGMVSSGGKFTISFDYEITGITTACTIGIYLRYTSTSSHNSIGLAIPVSVGNNSGHVEHTFTPTSAQMEYGTQFLVSGYGAGNNQGSVSTFSHIKLESGTKATDWTPAPEDTDSAISAVDAKFASYSTTTQMNSAIDVAKNSITQTVSETYATKTELTTTNGNVTSLASRVSTAESKLTKDSLVTTIGSYYATPDSVTEVKTVASQAADKISWIVKSGTSATDFALTDRAATLVANYINLNGLVEFSGLDSTAKQGIIDSVEVGGRNLLYNSGTYKDWMYYNTAAEEHITIDNDTATVSNNGSTSNVYYGLIQWVGDGRLSAILGKTITISFDVKSDDWASVVQDDSHTGIGALAVQLMRTDYTPFGGSYKARKYFFSYLNNTNYFKTVTPVDGGWVRVVSKPITITESLFNQGTASDGNDDYVVFSFQLRRNGTVSFRHFMIEEASTPSNWTPAPEDTDSVLGQWCYNNDRTYIDGGKIYTGTIDAGKITTGTLSANCIDVAGIFAKNITATGTISGATLTGAKVTTSTLAVTSTLYMKQNSSGSNLVALAAPDSTGVSSLEVGSGFGQVLVKKYLYCESGALIGNSNGLETTLNVSGKGYFSGGIQSVGNADVDGKVTCTHLVANGTDDNGPMIKVNGPFHIGAFQSSYSGNLGIYSTTYDKYIIYADSNGNVYIPSFTASGGLSANGAIQAYAGIGVYGSSVPYINFHYNGVTDTTSSIRETASGRLEVSGKLSVGGYTNDSYDLAVDSFICDGAVRVTGTNPFYFQDHGGGWYMSDDTWVRVYGGKSVYQSSGTFRTDGTLQVGNGGAYFQSDSSQTKAENLWFKDYGGGSRKPASSATADGTRVGYIASHTRSSDSMGYLTVQGDYGTTGDANCSSTKNFLATSSDIRLKENIRPSEVEALPVLNAIQIRQFDWKAGGYTELGLVADELELINPRFVFGGGYEDDGSMNIKSVDTFALMGYAVKGIQELCAADSALGRKIQEAGGRIAAYEARISSLESQLAAAMALIAAQQGQIDRMQGAA